MGTDIAKRDIPTPTPRHDESLSPQELAEHRQSIASEVEIVLSAYFQPTESEAVRAGQLSWWCDELQDWTRQQVVYALRQWNRDNPRRRPTPGDITSLLKQLRGHKEAERRRSSVAPTEDADRQVVTGERANEILAQAGISPRTFGGDA